MQKIAILYDASQAVMSTFNLDEVLARILSIIRDYFHIQNAAVALFDSRTGDLYIRSEYGRTPVQPVRLKVGQGIIGNAARLKRPIYVPDVSKDPRYVAGIESTRSELAIPLLVRDVVVGVLDLQSEQAHFFDKETIDLLTLFSTQASIALENARLYSLEQHRARQLEAINAVARHTTAVVELQELLERVCRLLVERFSLEHVAILMMEENRLVLRAHFGSLTPAVEHGAIMPSNAGLTNRAFSSGMSVLENDVRNVPGYIAGFNETAAEMCIPLVFFGEKLGILAVESSSVGAFQPEDLPPLESVADMCAAAIQNARYIERAKELAYLDGLTGIFNRRFFEMRITEELERANRYTTQLSVIMLDIDHFKRLNDEFGHLLGDEVLRQVSTIFRQQVRKGDVVCRFGGEEFALLLPQTSGEQAQEAAEKLRRLVENWNFPGVPRPVTISAGIACYPENGRTRDQIVSSADAALYSAKQTGRNRVERAMAVRSRSTE